MPFPFRVIVLSSALLGPLAFAPAEPSHAQNSNPDGITDWPSAPPLDPSAPSRTSDVGVTREIRDVLTTTPGLSVDARNVKITARAGIVTLEGPVRSDAERATVVAIAKRAPGVSGVADHMLVETE